MLPKRLVLLVMLPASEFWRIRCKLWSRLLHASLSLAFGHLTLAWRIGFSFSVTSLVGSLLVGSMSCPCCGVCSCSCWYTSSFHGHVERVTSPSTPVQSFLPSVSLPWQPSRLSWMPTALFTVVTGIPSPYHSLQLTLRSFLPLWIIPSEPETEAPLLCLLSHFLVSLLLPGHGDSESLQEYVGGFSNETSAADFHKVGGCLPSRFCTWCSQLTVLYWNSL